MKLTSLVVASVMTLAFAVPALAANTAAAAAANTAAAGSGQTDNSGAANNSNATIPEDAFDQNVKLWDKKIGDFKDFFKF